MKRAPFGARGTHPKGSSGCLDVGRLQALVALHDLELDALTLGQRLVPLHGDGGEVDEDVVSLLALDESVTLLVGEPLHGALSQLFLLEHQTTARAPSRRTWSTARPL